MSRWIIPRECRWARAVKRLWTISFAAGGEGADLWSRVSRSRGWKGKTRRKWEDREWVFRRGITLGCFAARRRRASRFESCGGWHWEGVVSLMARVCGPVGVDCWVL